MRTRIVRRAEPCTKFWVVVAQITAISLLCTACSTSNDSPQQLTTVTEVVDGDTVLLKFPNGDIERVRLLGIDTPETVDPTRPVQCFGPEASAYLNELLAEGTPVRLERDQEARDRFGRLLAYVFRSSDDLFINRDMVYFGFADISIYEPNTAHQGTLTAAVTSAMTSASGLWGACGGADIPLDPSQYDADGS